MGLINRTATMSKLMDMILGPELEPYCWVYIDDIVIVTPDFQTHIAVLYEVYERLNRANSTINFEKCEFCRPSLSYLGFEVGKDDLK